ncbi:MAG: M20/M25/M40 family metallo-hydrolase, partial [Acidobacteriota bacterium]|nr:M20/M25/M40 family metallo-hydrolase [Acidobacteriota bacterium]
MKKLLSFAAVALSLAAAADYTAEGDAWWAHVQFLAADSLQGRDTGSDGYLQAARYVAAKMDQYGLQPAGTGGYLQPVPFETRDLVPAQSSAALLRPGAAEPEPLSPAEAVLSARAESGAVEAPMIFAGYGLRIPEAHYDELAGLDLKGKIVVYVNAPGPADAPGPVKSHAGSAAERWQTLRAAGAIGTAVIMSPRAPTATAPLPAAVPRAPQKIFVLADPALQDQAGQKVALTITRAGGEKFFSGSGHSFEEILALARANQPLPKFPLAATLQATTAVSTAKVQAPNLAALLPGSDPRLKNEYVILSAHLDHVGVGRPVNGDAIYNGAMDDASGIASLLEIARLMQSAPERPRRSILFLAVTAEEKGELGSRYFAAHPTVPAASIVADINMDMFLPLFELKFLEVQGLAESTLGDTVRDAAAPFGVAVQADKEPEQNRFIRSDQYSFIRDGIPSLAFKF